MMSSLQSAFLISLLLIAVFVHRGDAIRCYECSSADAADCAKNVPPNSTSVDCNMPKRNRTYTFCRKIVQIIEFPVHDLPPDTRIIRGCGWDDSAYNGTCYERSGYGGQQVVCACNEDNCNGASSLSVTFGVLLFGAIVFLVHA